MLLSKEVSGPPADRVRSSNVGLLSVVASSRSLSVLDILGLRWGVVDRRFRGGTRFEGDAREGRFRTR